MESIRKTKRAPFFIGLFLLCMSTLMLQIVETRILSVVSMYYLAFFAISMAMLGMTAGSLLVYYKVGNIDPDSVALWLAKISVAFALSVFVCFLFQLASPLPNVKLATAAVIWAKMILLLATPYVLAGMAVSLALTRSPFPIGTTYGVDLLGAAFGCLAVLVVLNLVDGPSAMFIIAALPAAASVCFTKAAPAGLAPPPILSWAILRRPGWIAAGLLIIAVANSGTRYGFQPISAKSGLLETPSSLDFVRWNSFSRISVSKSRVEHPALWGASPAMPAFPVRPQRDLSIDANAGTFMPQFDGDKAEIEHLKYDITNLAYAARHSGRSAVIGVGSGRDLLSAHLFGFRDITGVELNPIFVDLLTDPAKLRGYAGVADLPGVRLLVDEGRSWFARTSEKFDLLQMSMIDTFAATGAGAFSLSENGLYTAEAWRVFLSALKPAGIFTVSRWYSPTATVEIGRTTSLGVAALMLLGVEKPRDHMFLAATGPLATLIISRAPLSPTDLTLLNDAAERLQFKVLASPGRASAAPIIEDLLSARDIADLDARAGQYLLDVSAPTDSRPFFFNQLRLSHPDDIPKILHEFQRSGLSLQAESNGVVSGNLIAMSTLFLIILLSLLVVVLASILPARSAVYAVDRRLALLGSGYFLLIGLGFMFVEIGLIQRLSIFLGHPVYALSVVLFSIIVSTGVGSLFSESLSVLRPIRLLLWLLILGSYLLLIPYWLPGLTHSSLQSAGLLPRALASVGVIFPAGILIGLGFPTGMKLVIATDARPTPWFWGINGAAGVLAAGLAVACSIGFSVDTTIRTGGACYLLLAPVALLLLGLVRRVERAAGSSALHWEGSR